MKLLCTGDFHLGSGAAYGTAPYGPGSRLADQAAVLEQIAELALNERVDAVLVAGDVFHKRRPDPIEMRVFTDWLGKLPVYLDVLICAGNHDVIDAERSTAVEACAAGFDRVEVYRTPDVWEHPQVDVAMLPWTPLAGLVAASNGGDRDRTYQAAAVMLVEEAQRLYARMEGAARRVLMAHWSVEGASLPNGLPVADLREVVLPLADLEAIGFDAVVLGHIHRAQVLTGDSEMIRGLDPTFQPPPIFYVGSPACVDFGEAKVPHACWIFDLEAKELRPVTLEDRAFVTFDGNITAFPPDTDILSAMLRGPGFIGDQVDGAVVRVRYIATEEQARRVDHAALTRALLDAGAHKVVGIQADILREGRQRDDRVDEGLSPLEALALYAERQDWTPPQLADATERTTTYLAEVGA